MFWWIFELAGIGFDTRSLFDLILVLPFYGMSITVLPILAYTVLLMVFVSAYRISGTGWIPGVVMLLGTPIALQWLSDWIVRITWTLPGWQVFANAPTALAERFGECDPEVAVEINEVLYSGIPVEPMLVMLAVTALLLLIAGRIWQEVEA